MTRIVICCVLGALQGLLSPCVAGADEPPAWAYPVNPPDFKPPVDDGSLRRVADSDVSYTLTQIRDRFSTSDWHPGDHPPMPEVVARGRKPVVFACGFCHRADGSGGPENANLAGLPREYIVQQVADFKSGARTSSVPKRAPITLLLSLAQAVSDDEIAAAAAYYSVLKPRRKITVVETESVPQTIVAGWFLADAKSGQMEPIGRRIIEVPESLEQFESRDSRARFIAYVPPGSIAKGEAYVATGGGGAVPPCATCHGPDLRGVGPIPPIVGRSTSYVVRQLFDFKSGARAGPGAAQMKPVAERLSLDDMIAVAAYLASRAP
jgi:cytochrome c553